MPHVANFLCNRKSHPHFPDRFDLVTWPSLEQNVSVSLHSMAPPLPTWPALKCARVLGGGGARRGSRPHSRGEQGRSRHDGGWARAPGPCGHLCMSGRLFLLPARPSEESRGLAGFLSPFPTAAVSVGLCFLSLVVGKQTMFFVFSNKNGRRCFVFFSLTTHCLPFATPLCREGAGLSGSAGDGEGSPSPQSPSLRGGSGGVRASRGASAVHVARLPGLHA